MKRDVKNEVLSKLYAHPLYKQVMQHLSDEQKELVNQRAENFIEAFTVGAVKQISSVENKEKLKEALKKYQEKQNNKTEVNK